MIFELFSHADSFTKPMTPQQTAALDVPPLVQVNETPPHNNQMNLGEDQKNMDFGAPPSPDAWAAAPAGQFGEGGDIESKYKEINGTWFHKDTPAEICNILSDAIKSRRRLKFYWGDQKTGHGWNEEYDISGRVGRSTGSIKIPLLITTSRSIGGGAIMDDAIVKIKDIESGKVLWQHPQYVQPKVEIVPSDKEGYTHNTMVNGELHGRHKSLKSAQITASRIMEDGGEVIQSDKK